MRTRKGLLEDADILLKAAKEFLGPAKVCAIERWRLSFEVELDKRDELVRLRQLLERWCKRHLLAEE